MLFHNLLAKYLRIIMMNTLSIKFRAKIKIKNRTFKKTIKLRILTFFWLAWRELSN